MIYLDYNSTKPAHKDVAEYIKPILGMALNPSPVHKQGKGIKKLMDEAKFRIKNTLKAHCHEIIFCSSGTESVNMVFNAMNFDNVFCLCSDHECSINNPKSFLISVDEGGIINLSHLKQQLDANSQRLNLVSFCLANNQSGVIQPYKQIVELVRQCKNTFIHVDAVQFLTKEYFSFAEDGMDFDFVSASSHKIGAIGGSGLLIYKSELDIKPLFYGGGQQGFKRAGTENVIGAISTGLAIEMFANKQYIGQYKSHTAELQNYLEGFLTKNNCVVFAKNSPRLTNTTFFSMPNCSNSIQLVEYDLNSICVSAGSACSSGKVGVSHVLLSMGVDKYTAQNALRISIDMATTKQEIDKFCEVFLRLMSRTNY